MPEAVPACVVVVMVVVVVFVTDDGEQAAVVASRATSRTVERFIGNPLLYRCMTRVVHSDGKQFQPPGTPLPIAARRV